MSEDKKKQFNRLARLLDEELSPRRVKFMLILVDQDQDGGLVCGGASNIPIPAALEVLDKYTIALRRECRLEGEDDEHVTGHA